MHKKTTVHRLYEPRHNLLLADHVSSPGFELMTLELGRTLVEMGTVASHAYFPVHGVISVLSSTTRGDTVEVAAVGREGIAASPGILGAVASPFQLLVQVPGTAFRIEPRVLIEHAHTMPALRARLFGYLNVLVGQIAQSAVCNRYHTGQQRLARWLLTVSDRANMDTMPMTHEFAALMVGGLRPRVTSAIRGLRDHGLIRHRRGEVTILDRDGLTQASCECYAAVQSYVAQLRQRQ